MAAETSLKSCSWGAKILASTSLSSVKWRTSSFGRAVIVSAKCVIAGNMSMGWSPTVREAGGSLAPTRPALRELRGGFVRVCRTGCDLRCDEGSAGRGLADFIVKIAVAEVVVVCGETSDEKRRTRKSATGRGVAWERGLQSSSRER